MAVPVVVAVAEEIIACPKDVMLFTNSSSWLLSLLGCKGAGGGSSGFSIDGECSSFFGNDPFVNRKCTSLRKSILRSLILGQLSSLSSSHAKASQIQSSLSSSHFAKLVNCPAIV